MAGLLSSLMGGGQGGGLLSDPMLRLQMGAQMMQGKSLGDQLGGAFGAAAQYGMQRKQLAEQMAEKNKTLDYLRQQDPELAQAVEAGVLDPVSAYKAHLERQKPQQPDYMEVGGQLFNPANNQWIAPPPNPNDPIPLPKAPEMQTLYDERGAEYKAQWMPETQTWERIGGSKAGSNGITITNPDGTTTQIGGSGGKTTEADRRASLLAGQMQGSATDALANFDALASAKNTGAAMGGSMGRAIMDPKAQVAKDAITNVVANWLYLTSGATATPDELRKQAEMLTPTALDDDMTVAAKRARLQSIVDEMNKRGGIPSGPALNPANVRKTQSGVGYSVGQ